MPVLGIETSGDVAGVAVVDARGVAAEITFRHNLALSRFLVPRIAEVLALAGVEMAALGGVAVSVGPGSFTGLRIGVTTAKMLAYARGIPVAGIGTLAALAAERPAPPQALLCALIPASATHVFAALYQWREGRPERRAEETLLPAEELAQKLARTPLEVVLAGDPGPHRALLAAALGPRLVLSQEAPAPRAATVARLGRDRLVAGQADPVHALAPCYLRASAAEARRKEAACPLP
jgi:tRNA threonylcarbamoyladenosine biosynthesis protein TsaB